ncbi:hypothetical protein TSUD_421110, partial [Trifolium subterraneum]
CLFPARIMLCSIVSLTCVKNYPKARRVWEIRGDGCLIPDPCPELPPGKFCLHPRPHGEKISVFGSPNGAIHAGIYSNRCKLTSLIALYQIYGIDASSGAVVMALGIEPGDHVLDLCAALDLLGDSGSVTGVDAAKHRLAACRTMLQKYKLGDRCQLFVADGTTFSVIPEGFRSDSESCESRMEERMDVFMELTSKRPWKERKRENKCGTPQVVSKSHPPELI